jgi:hypothetical protein
LLRLRVKLGKSIDSGRSLEMGKRFFSIAGLATGLLATIAVADGPPERQTVKVELKAEPNFYGGKDPERINIDMVVSAMPPEISAAVKEWTGIAEWGRTMTVKFFHTPRNGRFDAMSYAADTGSYKGFIKFGEKVLQDEETHVKYTAAMEASDEKTFLVVGAIEFENAVTKHKCFVLCQIEGTKPPASKDDPFIPPTGTATWIGPITRALRPPPPQDNDPRN